MNDNEHQNPSCLHIHDYIEVPACMLLKYKDFPNNLRYVSQLTVPHDVQVNCMFSFSRVNSHHCGQLAIWGELMSLRPYLIVVQRSTYLLM